MNSGGQKRRFPVRSIGLEVQVAQSMCAVTFHCTLKRLSTEWTETGAAQDSGKIPARIQTRV